MLIDDFLLLSILVTATFQCQEKVEMKQVEKDEYSACKSTVKLYRTIV